MHGLRLCESRGRDPGDRHDNARAHRFPGPDFLSGYNDDTGTDRFPGPDFLSGCDDNAGTDRFPGRDDDPGAHRHARRDRYDRPGRYTRADSGTGKRQRAEDR